MAHYSLVPSTKYHHQAQKTRSQMHQCGKHVKDVWHSFGMPCAFSLSRVHIIMTLFREPPGCIIKRETDVIDLSQTRFLCLVVIQ